MKAGLPQHIFEACRAVKWTGLSLSTGPKVIELFSCSTQLSMKFILLINKPTIVGILTFISMINTTSERLKARECFVGILVFMSS